MPVISLLTREIYPDDKYQDASNFVEAGMPIGVVHEGKMRGDFKNLGTLKRDLQSLDFGNVVAMTQKLSTLGKERWNPRLDPEFTH